MKVTDENIFSDLGLDDANEMKARSDLLSEVAWMIRASNLPQKKIALILGISQPKVSALMSGKINDFSADTLMQYLTMLGCNIEIRVSPRSHVSRKIRKGVMSVKRKRMQRKKSRALFK